MLLVHSKSTERYADDWGYSKRMLVTNAPTAETLKLKREFGVIAIGGGSVIDAAKILSRGPVIAVPTTYSGASRTSHAVYWDNEKKCNKNAEKPITVVKPEYLETLPEEIGEYSKADCLCHVLESLTSKKSSNQVWFYASKALSLISKGDWLNASLLAGDAIEITGTNLIHALSYALTSKYKIPHSKALAFLLPKFLSLYSVDVPSIIPYKPDLDIDIKWVIEEAFTYSKISDCNFPVSEEILRRLLE